MAQEVQTQPTANRTIRGRFDSTKTCTINCRKNLHDQLSVRIYLAVIILGLLLSGIALMVFLLNFQTNRGLPVTLCLLFWLSTVISIIGFSRVINVLFED